jgi:hypothetical protein
VNELFGAVPDAGRCYEAVEVPAPRPPLWKQPLTLLMIALTLAGLVLLFTGPWILGVGLIGIGALVNTVVLVRFRIRDTDDDLRTKNSPK